jgi:hypothetical protein
MKKYTIYFEIFGKKMKAHITAKSKDSAINQLKDKIVIHDIKANDDEILTHLKNIFGI